MAKSQTFEDRWKVWRLTAYAVTAGLALPIGSNLVGSLGTDIAISPGFESVATLLLGLAWLFAIALPLTIVLNAIALLRAHSSVSHPVDDPIVRRRVMFMWAFFLCSLILSAGLLIGVVMSLRHG